MAHENTTNTIPQRYRERIKNLRLLDDDFFSVCFADDVECTQLLLRILLDRDDLKVIDVKTQYRVKNLRGREIILDAFATDSNEVLYNVEVQRKTNGASPKRARYYSSMIDANLFPSGLDFGILPESYVIFITEKDALRGGLPIYHIDRMIRETNEAFGDQSHIVYVNAAITGNSALGKLMHDFNCTEPDRMNYSLLAEKTRHFKEKDKGAKEMCDFWEELKAEGRAEGLQEAKEKIEKAEAETRQAKEKAEAEARLAAQVKEKAEAEARLAAQVKEKAEAEARLAAQVKEKAEAEARQAKEKAEAEARQAKEKAEAEARQAREKAEAEARQAKEEAEAETRQAKEMVQIKTTAIKKAFKMLLSGKLTVEEIADYTDLSLEEVQEFAALMAH